MEETRADGENLLPSTPAEVRGNPGYAWAEDGICALGNYEGGRGKSHYMEETRDGRAKYCILQLPSNSADVCESPRRVWKEDGRWQMGNYAESKAKLA